MPRLIPPSPATLRAYRQTRYEAGTVLVKIGRYPEGLGPKCHRCVLVMLGAANPGGKPRPARWNERKTQQLRGHLRRFHFTEASGSLRRWSEPMLLVRLDVRPAIVLARRFGQNAVVIISEKRRSELVVLKSN